MGTSEEIRSEQQQRQRLHAQYPVDAQHLQAQHAQQQHLGFSSPLAFPPFAPSPPVNSSSSWPHEKLSESDVAHASQAMDVDPVQDNQLNERKSPSPTHYDGGASVFHFGESNNQQQQQQQPQATYADFVATPITRFLTKQTFGFIPRPSFPSPSDGVPPRSAPASPLQTSKIPSLRLPSLSAGGSLPQSPLSSPSQGSFSTPVGDALSQLFNSASLGNNSNPGTPTSIPVRSSTVTLPPLKRACVSPTTTLPPLSQRISFDDICKPFRYQRSMSCPSDAMARGVAEAAAAEQNEMESEAYAAPPFVLQRADVPKARVERSNSVDASAVLAMREAHHRALHGGEPSSRESSMDFHGWLDRSNADRHPLASLAESAYAMQRLSTNQESPRSLASANVSGDDESMNPFDVSDSSDLRREKKLCAFPQCSSNAVTRGLCISHGGGRRCQRKGCTRGAQSKGLCVAHGGGRICKAKGCSNIQRSMGLCIRHGGGKRCSVPGCQKGVVRQDLCTAHGGKRKCKVEDCNKHVKKKGLCRSHANSVLGASAVSSPRGAVSPEYSS